MNHSIDWMSKEERLIKERELAGGYWDHVKKRTALVLMEFAANLAPGIFGMLAQRGVRAVMDELTEFTTTGTIHGPVFGEAVKTGSLHYDLAHAREMLGVRDRRNKETVYALAKAVADKDEDIVKLQGIVSQQQQTMITLQDRVVALQNAAWQQQEGLAPVGDTVQYVSLRPIDVPNPRSAFKLIGTGVEPDQETQAAR